MEGGLRHDHYRCHWSNRHGRIARQISQRFESSYAEGNLMPPDLPPGDLAGLAPGMHLSAKRTAQIADECLVRLVAPIAAVA